MLPTPLIARLLSARSVNPELLKPMKIQFETWQQKPELFGDAVLNKDLRQQLLMMLLGII
jgi:hypothetical protein